MIFFTLLLAVVTSISAGALAFTVEATTESTLIGRAGTRPGWGTHDGYYYYFWTDGAGNVTYTNKAGGEYSAEWSGQGNWFGGKGWNLGSARNITFSGTWETTGTSYLSVYGQTNDPFIEYYIVESFGTYDPGKGGQKKGNLTSDGSVYDIYLTNHYPISMEDKRLRTFWSVRRDHRTSGTVTTANHFDAWAQAGLNLSTHQFQIMATEGYFSNGTADITVS